MSELVLEVNCFSKEFYDRALVLIVPCNGSYKHTLVPKTIKTPPIACDLSKDIAMQHHGSNTLNLVVLVVTSILNACKARRIQDRRIVLRSRDMTFRTSVAHLIVRIANETHDLLFYRLAYEKYYLSEKNSYSQRGGTLNNDRRYLHGSRLTRLSGRGITDS